MAIPAAPHILGMQAVENNGKPVICVHPSIGANPGSFDTDWGALGGLPSEQWILFADEQKHVAEANKNYTIPSNVVTALQQIQIPDAATVPVDTVIKLRNIDQYDFSFNVPTVTDFDVIGPPTGSPTPSSVGGIASGLYPLTETGPPAAGQQVVWTFTSTANDWLVTRLAIPETVLPEHLGTYVLDGGSAATVTATTTPTKQGLLATRVVGDNIQAALFDLPIQKTPIIDLYILKASIDAANPPAFSMRGSPTASYCYRKPHPTTGVLETDAAATDTGCTLVIQQFHDLGDQWFYRLAYTFADETTFTQQRFNMLPSGITAVSPSAAVEFSFRAYDSEVPIIEDFEDVLIDVEGVDNTLYPFAGGLNYAQVKGTYSKLLITGHASWSGVSRIEPYSLTVDLALNQGQPGFLWILYHNADGSRVAWLDHPADANLGLRFQQTLLDSPTGGRMALKVVGQRKQKTVLPNKDVQVDKTGWVDGDLLQYDAANDQLIRSQRVVHDSGTISVDFQSGPQTLITGVAVQANDLMLLTVRVNGADLEFSVPLRLAAVGGWTSFGGTQVAGLMLAVRSIGGNLEIMRNLGSSTSLLARYVRLLRLG